MSSALKDSINKDCPGAQEYQLSLFVTLGQQLLQLIVNTSAHTHINL